MKKSILFIVFILIIATVFVGCTDSKEDKNDDRDVSSDDITISTQIVNRFAKINRIDDNSIDFEPLSYHMERILHFTDSGQKHNLSNKLSIQLLEDRYNLKYKTVEKKEFIQLIKDGKFENSTFVVRIADDDKVINIKESPSLLEKKKDGSKEEIIRSYAEFYMFKKVFDIENPDISIAKSQITADLTGVKLTDPNLIYSFDDLLEGSTFELWDLKFNIKTDGDVYEEEKEATGYKDGWITKPYGLDMAYMMVELKNGKPKLLGLAFKSEGEIKDKELARQKFKNYLRVNGRFDDRVWRDKVIKIVPKIKASDEILVGVRAEIVDRAKEEVAKIVYDINMKAHLSSTKPVEGDIITEAEITSIKDMGLAQVGLNSGEMLYVVEYRLKSKEDSVISQLFDIEKKDGYIVSIKEHPRFYLAHVWNSEQSYIAKVFNQLELDRKLNDIKEKKEETERIRKVFNNILKDSIY